MPSRRHHSKSRNGCLQCKARKVKCDQHGPICGNCARREESCSLTDSHHHALQSAGPHEAELSSATYTLRDLELVHHFTATIPFTLSNNSRQQRMWQIDVPREALRHPYLMHCILSVSALHLLSVSKAAERESYRAVAVRYHDSALSTFRRLLENITPENCNPLCACSYLFVIFTSAYGLLPGSNDYADPIRDIIDLCELGQGATVIVLSAHASLLGGMMAPMLKPAPWDIPSPLSADATGAFLALSTKIEELPSVDTNKETYLDALKTLRHAFTATAFNPDIPPLVFMFLSLVKRPYVELLKTGNMMAFVLLAHYAVLLHELREQWWLGDRGFRIVKHIHGMLEPESRPLIYWPMRRVGLPVRAVNSVSGTSSPSSYPSSNIDNSSEIVPTIR